MGERNAYMKVLHVLAQLPSRTGSGVYYTNIIEGFKKYNYEQRAIFGYQDEYTWDILDKVRLVFCAKIDPSKGIYELIEVYKSLCLDDVTLDIIGEPNEENKDKIKKYIDGDSNIRLYNVKNQEALAHELREKDIFIMPSYYEGLGLMAIESLACGLYVVTTEIEALMTLLGEEIKESGIIKYVPLPRIYDTDKPVKEDLPEFKENLKKALLSQIEKIRNKEQFQELMEEKVLSFSWEALVDNMNNIIYNI